MARKRTPTARSAKGRPARVVCMGDMHCGHAVGLTPSNMDGGARFDCERRLYEIRRECWSWYAKTIQALQPIDLLVVNGDCIDGRGERSGSVEQIVVDRDRQAEMAIQCIRQADAANHVFTYGTAYHTGQEEDWEARIASEFDAPIGSHEWPEVRGLVFDVKHHLGSSSIPHGRHTAIARDRMWNILWGERGQQPKASVFIRSHVHYHQHCGGIGWLAMTLPALQAAATKYGARRCSGTVDFGFVSFDVYEGGSYTWQVHAANLVSQKAQPSRFSL